ncbi:MAG: HAMP domain-containing protein [Clostridia bacterium]|nr:HAMP domain-containing protein [Clostridia bacterium]
MKFWKKLALFIIATIAIILAISRYYVVNNNFINAISDSSKQNANKYILEKYMIESYIIKTIQNGEEATNEKIMEYVQQLYSHMENDSELVALYSQDYKKLYSNIEEIEKLDVESILNKETESYSLRKIGEKHYMIFSSNWSINEDIMYIINVYDIENIYKEKKRQMNEILFADIIILLVSGIAIIFFSLLLTKDIKVLNKKSKEIAQGKYGEKVKIKSKDEIGELAESFNSMSEQVENKINELNLLINQKDDFINGFTHELKTPMTAIVGYADMLRLRKCNEELTQKAINYIYQESKRLEVLSFKLMTLMSLTNEKILMTNINIKEFVGKIDKVEKNILSKNKLEIEIEEAVVKGDYELLEIVIRNLVENANKAEPKDNKVIIRGEKTQDGKYKISVIDRGKGIPKEHIEKVTEDFYMVDKSRSRINGGSGIGLSLVKKILLLHSSSIKIESIENEGTTVYFELEEVQE